MQKKKRILFISHEASITGAPILFLNLIRLIKEFNEYHIDIICVKNGPLLDKFKEYGHTAFFKSADYRKEHNVFKGLLNKFLFLFKILTNMPSWLRADIVFNNTISNGLIIRFYSTFKRKTVLSYIHELEKYTRSESQWKEAIHVFQLSDIFISPSSYNKNLMSAVFHLPIQKFRLLPYMIYNNLSETIQSRIDHHKAEAKNAFLKEKNLPLDNLTVLGMGTFDKRKGIDYFIETASILKNKNVTFFWIGDGSQPVKDEMNLLIKDKDINNFYHLGVLPHDLSNFLPFDLLFLSSREDPYPVVVLEAAATKIPAICFADSGGIVDFISDDCGWIVEDFSVNNVAHLIENISKSSIEQKGLSAMKKVALLHLDRYKIYACFNYIVKNALIEN